MSVAILSYRGPSGEGKVNPGGVSAGLKRIFDMQQTPYWYYMQGNNLMRATSGGATVLLELPEEMVTRHYSFCNRYLWPLFHGLAQAWGEYRPADHRAYKKLNKRVSKAVAADMKEGGTELLFVQDYQWALAPGYLRKKADRRNFGVTSFWHIPIPARERLDDHGLIVIAEMLRGMLGSDTIGVHTPGYQRNVLNLVHGRLPGFTCDRSLSAITALDADAQVRVADTSEIVVCPLGIDYEWWRAASKGEVPVDLPDDVKLVVVVARGDYTKAVREAARTVEQFFLKYPQHLGKVVFYLLVTPTREKVDAFVNYWQNLERIIEGNDNPEHGDVHEGVFKRVLARWQAAGRPGGWDGWTPIIWQKSLVEPTVLAPLYRRSSVNWVAPLVDGLNLTAIEWVACQSMKNPGVLLLSSGAGAHHELGDFALEANPEDTDQMANALHQALEIAGTSRAGGRLGPAKDRVRSQLSIDHWWRLFCQRARIQVPGGATDED